MEKKRGILAEQQGAQLHREGYLCLESFTTPDDVALIRSLIDGLYDRFEDLPKDLAYDLGDEKVHDGQQQTPQINDISRFEPRVRDTEYFKRAWSLSRQVLGDDAQPIGEHAIYKPPRNQRATPWHQDQAYWDPGQLYHALNFWMPLDDVTVESGCMHFVPYSHLGDLLPHHKANHNPQAHTLETDQVDPSQGKACPIPGGGVTIHFPKTLHYTGPNQADRTRRALILVFGYHWPAGS